MFIIQAFTPKNSFGKYLLGSLIIILASFAGQLPLTIAIAIKALTRGSSMPTTNAQLYRFMDQNLMLFLLLLSFVFALGGIMLAVIKLHHQKFKEIITSRHKIDWKRILFSFFIWALFSVATTLYAYYASPEDYEVQFNLNKFLILCVIAIPMIPIQTTVEELVFRGYLMQGFGLLAKNRWFPLAMTSLIFGCMHLLNPEVEEMGYIISLYYIGTGLCLGIMTLMDDGTELALGFHAANNLIAALLITSDWSVLQTPAILKEITKPSAGIDILLPILIIYPILLFIFAKKYKWSGWKDKLTGKIVFPVPEKVNPNSFNNEY
ncbi:abortive phage infection protein [Flavobacterium rivuli WB 3.3-2 = DSM 21788]|uniref:Abortive phage infection protein n=1 Tax=Flavobacterium rivuli WB 3.3-2 = DSM 21788 TaxID=1121895 RepID=A0A0A2MAP7_9FLAO|nr:CPBP family intramembrane glutamic endopeptidase [Flavobacterium rivuli]KGO88533.1 abortive phage infection protein [Flavobacterium rivuli WB 3.3-2 = DSM 21788]